MHIGKHYKKINRRSTDELEIMERQVIKIGSDVTVNDEGRVNIDLVRNIGLEMKQLDDEKIILPILVFSGYVKAGKALLGEKRKTKDISYDELEKIVLAGKDSVLKGLSKAFEGLYDIDETLFTYHQLYRNEERHNHLKHFIREAYIDSLAKDVLLATNYDDLKDKSEIKKDNDKFAAYLAVTLNANRLIILGDKYEGLLSDVNDKDSLVRNVEIIEQRHYDYCKGCSHNGTGGMETKIEAADIATLHGIETVIGNARAGLMNLMNNREGTRFHAKENYGENVYDMEYLKYIRHRKTSLKFMHKHGLI